MISGQKVTVRREASDNLLELRRNYRMLLNRQPRIAQDADQSGDHQFTVLVAKRINAGPDHTGPASKKIWDVLLR